MSEALRSEALSLFRGSRAATFLAIADRIVPGVGLRAPGAKSEATLRTAEVFMSSQDESVRAKLRLLLKVFDWGALLKYGRRFTRLPAEKQDGYLRAWEFSQFQIFRFAFSSLRNLVFVSYYTQQETWPTMGYPGPWLEAMSAKP